jgi:hypothetical protein
MRPRGLLHVMAERPNGPRPDRPGPAGATSSAHSSVVTTHYALTVARQVRAHQRPAQEKVFVWSTGAESGRRQGGVRMEEGGGGGPGSMRLGGSVRDGSARCGDEMANRGRRWDTGDAGRQGIGS